MSYDSHLSLTTTPKKHYVYVKMLSYIAEHPHCTKKMLYEEGLGRQKEPWGKYNGHEYIHCLVRTGFVDIKLGRNPRTNPDTFTITELGKKRLEAAI